jgi:hypothetical protein
MRPWDKPWEYLFAFEDPHSARRFVVALVLNLDDVAIFIDGCEVYVLDAAIDNRRDRIVQLARSSSSSHVRQVRMPTE